MIIAKYKLKKDLPFLDKGVIFEHRRYDFKYPDRGNPGCGVLILGWINGSCQGRWCGETYIFPGQLVENTEWFEKIEEKPTLDKDNILAEIERLRELIISLKMPAMKYRVRSRNPEDQVDELSERVELLELLLEKAVDQLRLAQEDAYVQYTQNLIDEIKTALIDMHN